MLACLFQAPPGYQGLQRTCSVFVLQRFLVTIADLLLVVVKALGVLILAIASAIIFAPNALPHSKS